MGYIYQAGHWCNPCGEDIKRRLKEENREPEDPTDDYSFDSDDYPKYFDEENESSDSPCSCAAMSDCKDKIMLRSNGKDLGTIGSPVCPGLTPDGCSYVLSTILDSAGDRGEHKEWHTAVAREWWERYKDQIVEWIESI